MKIGVVGTGHFGKVHLNCIRLSEVFDLVGFYDINNEISKQVAKSYNIKIFNSLDELLQAVDVVDIVTPATSHYNCIKKALEKNKHVFVEKPMVVSTSQAKEIKKIVQDKNLKLQIGHVERFNPSFYNAKSFLNNVKYIETNRHSVFNNRNVDVSVVHDLMIHDIDIVLNTVKSDVKKIDATGFSFISKDVDVVNARVEFKNGCVANFNASRIASENKRETFFYTDNTLAKIDYNNKKTLITQINTNTSSLNGATVANGVQLVNIKPKNEVVNSVVKELKSFYASIANNTEPEVSVFDGCKAVNLANDILDAIK